MRIKTHSASYANATQKKRESKRETKRIWAFATDSFLDSVPIETGILERVGDEKPNDKNKRIASHAY
jgi:hypothetical protein